jgi:hypothetical protein
VGVCVWGGGLFACVRVLGGWVVLLARSSAASSPCSVLSLPRFYTVRWDSASFFVYPKGFPGVVPSRPSKNRFERGKTRFSRTYLTPKRSFSYPLDTLYLFPIREEDPWTALVDYLLWRILRPVY